MKFLILQFSLLYYFIFLRSSSQKHVNKFGKNTASQQDVKLHRLGIKS